MQRSGKLHRFSAICLFFSSFSVGLPGLTASADAAVFTVTKEIDDDGPCDVDDCALREAIIAANANPGMDTILVPGGEYQLSIPGSEESQAMTGDLNLRDDVEILGDDQSPVVIRGDGSDRVFHISTGTTASLSHLTITGGAVPASGGGVRITLSRVTIRDCIIRGNRTLDGDGGGVLVGLSDVTIVNSTITDNTADDFGGGIYRLGFVGTVSRLTLINTTVSGNSAFEGGGVYNDHVGELVLTNTTITDNIVTFRGEAVVSTSGSRATWTNTLVQGRCALVAAIAPTSNGGNIESPGSTCFVSHPTDRMNVADLNLGPLADNGGPTPTHALLPGSPAIDGGVAAGCPSTDQRGEPRPTDGDGDGVPTCDVGAFEAGVVGSVPLLDRHGIAVLGLALAFAGWQALRRRLSH